MQGKDLFMQGDTATLDLTARLRRLDALPHGYAGRTPNCREREHGQRETKAAPAPPHQ